MSSAIQEANEEFEDQFRLQQEAAERERVAANQTKKTRIDEDGTVMEWDDEKHAWFPKIDDDFIASYQMNFGIQNEQESAHTAWRQFAVQIERLKIERGLDDEEVKRGMASLNEYYQSPAYRVWYEEYQKRQCEANEGKEKDQKRLEARRKPHQPIDVSADDALRRAEEEQRLGIPIPKTEAENPPEGIQSEKQHEQPSEGATKKKKKRGPPEWYEVSPQYRLICR